jgi:hypothetical protein
MTVRKGAPWGSAGDVPEGAVEVRSDAEAADVLDAARRERRPYPPLALLGGDLCRTLGGRGGLTTVATVDLGEALVDGAVRLFVAHAVVRGPTRWRGPIVAACNAQYVGPFDVAPRAHPGDGLLDVVEVAAAMGVGERWKAWRRLPSGSHVPHPAITVRRTAAVQLDVAGRRIVLDGRRLPPARTLSVRLEPDALLVAV